MQEALKRQLPFSSEHKCGRALKPGRNRQRKTRVKIVCSPDYSKNIHEIEIESSAGKTFIRCENNPCPDNPKTSYLAVLSAIAALKEIFEPVKIGT